MPEDTEDDPREILAALAAQLTQRAELDCPFALTPPPLQLKRTEQAARDRELAARQATLPIWYWDGTTRALHARYWDRLEVAEPGCWTPLLARRCSPLGGGTEQCA